MTTGPSSIRTFPVVLQRTAALLMVSFAFFCGATTSAMAAGQSATKGRQAATSGPTTFLYFNMTPAGSYDVERNGNLVATEVASPPGTIGFSQNVAVNDRITVTLTSVVPVDPSVPVNVSASGTSSGCAVLSWDTPAAAEYVSDYRLLWGSSPGVYTDSTAFDVLRVVQQGGTSIYTGCGFVAGTYYFALRSHNQFDRWSGRSLETVATISTGTTQGPPAPSNVQVSESSPGCAVVSWDPVGDPTVARYRVYWGTRSLAVSTPDDSTESQNPSTNVCGFAAGTYYFAVRSVTAGGVMSGFSAQRQITLQGVDTAGPIVQSQNPPNGATDVGRNTAVTFVVSDYPSGVDLTTLDITIAGQSAVSVVTIGSSESYYVQCRPAAELPADADITVQVDVSDLGSPANATSLAWSFRTGAVSISDVTPPVLSAVTPRPGTTGVRRSSSIVVSARDDDSGVDIGAIAMFVDDVPVAFTLEGGVTDLRLSYQAPGGLPAGSEVTVRVEACDEAEPSNCSEPLVYTFTVEGAQYASLGDGAIVPDGFWANEPDRPLEVRNLPLDWTIRIFDAAGTQVTRFRNNVTDGANWIWDFTNDRGHRVARALYLVRVFDAQGNVRQSGRFLVQIDP